jgi:hypothetical protein
MSVRNPMVPVRLSILRRLYDHMASGIVKLLGGSRELDALEGEQGRFGLCGELDAADVVPRLEGAGALGAVVGCRHAVAGQEEEVVDLVVGGQEALGVPGRLESFHLAFSSAGRLV